MFFLPMIEIPWPEDNYLYKSNFEKKLLRLEDKRYTLFIKNGWINMAENFSLG